MNVAVFGGDKRMLFAAKAFLNDGCNVSIAGFDDIVSLCDICVTNISDAAADADIAVLPVIPSADGYLNAPFSADKVTVGELMRLLSGKPVFTGRAGSLPSEFNGKIYDYSAREDFLYRNAELTAEGALSIIMDEYEGSVFGSEALVLGCGRIGKMLSAYLRALGAQVTVAARKPHDRAYAELSGMRAVGFDCIDHGRYDLIFNTVPAAVVSSRDIANMRDDVFIIDLASAPGGIDFDAAALRELTCIHALSLPGKTAPLAAGTIIKDTIFNMIKEENGGKDNPRIRDDRLLLHLG